MNSPSKVGEIFTAAGAAFNKLAELTLQLHATSDTPSGGKWTEEDIEMLKSAILKFNEDLNLVSDNITRKTVSQIRSTLKKQAYEDAGVPARQIGTSQSQGMLVKEVTLNMLNASESEDVEDMHDDVDLN